MKDAAGAEGMGGRWKRRRAEGGSEGKGREDRRIGGVEETGGPLREETRPSPLCQAAF